MHILRIEHEVQNYEGWKKAFDSNPINRKRSGVRCYRIYKTAGEPVSVMVELDFENKENLQTTLLALQQMWNNVQGVVVVSPKVQIVEMIESKDL